ncbi:MAG: ABC transporter ATP-binding protein [Candidatus Methanomethylophilaceae archaeon]|nr:ABC transporter ATP-binding protein [Candidatus Methanomethylophilaceae archaeon]
MTPVLRVESLTFGYDGGTLVKDLTFEVGPGEILAVMGRNGVGKTTLIRCILGMKEPTSGHCTVSGRTVSRNMTLDGIGYVPQARSLVFPYAVRDFVMFGRLGSGSIFASPSDEDYARADECLADVGLSEFKDRPIDRLSGGQLQLAYLAKALVNEPTLLVLDEPESHLDLHNEMMILDVLRHVVKERSIACVINTHHVNSTLKIADSCLIIGKDAYVSGRPSEVIDEDVIREFFGVDGRIVHYELDGITRSEVVVLSHTL